MNKEKRNVKKWTIHSSIALVAILLSSLHAEAAPSLINYQGILTDSNGAVIADGDYSVHFGIYADSTGGIPLWFEFDTLTVTDGLFHVLLGGHTPIDETLFEASPRWLGVKVGDDPQIAPRMKIATVPWAFRAVVADSAVVTGGATGDGDWTIVGDDMYADVSGAVGIGTTVPAADLNVVGSDTLGRVVIGPDVLNGGSSELFLATDNDGTFGVKLRADDSALLFFGKSGSSVYGPNLRLDQYGPRLTIEGDTSSVVFAPNVGANGSAFFPTGSIDERELFNEPGIATSAEGHTFITLDGNVNTLLSSFIDPTRSGYVLVIGTCQPIMTVGPSGTVWANFGVSDQGTFPPNQDVQVRFDGTSGDVFSASVTVHGIFALSSIGDDLLLIAQQGSADGTIEVYDTQLSLIYLPPTAYGSVDTTATFAAKSVPDEEAREIPAMTEADIAAGQVRAEEANRARIERELADMRRELAELEARIEAANERIRNESR